MYKYMLIGIGDGGDYMGSADTGFLHFRHWMAILCRTADRQATLVRGPVHVRPAFHLYINHRLLLGHTNSDVCPLLQHIQGRYELLLPTLH